MRNELVSIIMPVYNAGDYLNLIFQDILNQTYQMFELIVINDGSMDNSWEVIQSFASRDARIVAINVKNGGPSKARNIGLQKAKGTYIRFVDADDRLPAESISKLVEWMTLEKDIDLVIGNYRCMPEHNYYKGDEFENMILEPKDFAKCFVKNMKAFYYGVTWNKLYKKEIIQEKKLFFEESMDWCEDLCFNLDYYANCKKICLCSLNDGIYTYCSREKSITSELSKRASVELEKVDKICYEKAYAYCVPLGLERTVQIEWKYYNLYYQLSEIILRKEKHKYKTFKALLCRKDVEEYIEYKHNESHMWKFFYFIIDKKIYFIAYILFWLKGFVVSRFGKFVPRMKSWLHKFLPKVL